MTPPADRLARLRTSLDTARVFGCVTTEITFTDFEAMLTALDAAEAYQAGQAGLLHELNQAHGVAQALEQQLLHAHECWEPGHVYRDAPPYDTQEKRQTRVHCVMCTDAAMERAKSAGHAAGMAKAREVIELYEATLRLLGADEIYGSAWMWKAAREALEKAAALRAGRGE